MWIAGLTRREANIASVLTERNQTDRRAGDLVAVDPALAAVQFEMIRGNDYMRGLLGDAVDRYRKKNGIALSGKP